MRIVGYFVLFFVGCCHTKDWVRGSVVSFTTPVFLVDARTSASSRATVGSIRATWPFFAANAIRSTLGPPEYWNMPCSESGLMIVLVWLSVPGELSHS